MTPLRQTMIQAMCQHGFSPRTQKSYLYVVTELARYYRRSPPPLSAWLSSWRFRLNLTNQGRHGSIHATLFRRT
jgi:hypothetical protein